MAKQMRASARRRTVSRKAAAAVPKTGLKTSASRTANAVAASRAVFTPETLDYARHRYEQTDASLADIAVDLRIHLSTVRKLAKREGWSRYVRPPRKLPAAVRLALQASELEAQASGAAVTTIRPSSDTEKSLGDGIQPQADEKSGTVGARTAMSGLADTVARLYRAVLDELAAVETLRAQLKREPQSRHGAEHTARTLSSLTETLQKLQRLQCAVSPTGSYDDDMPADIDEFRRELARRIEAFVAGRPDPGDAGGSVPSSLDVASR